MSVLQGITGAVRANIAGAANRAVKSAASQVKSIAGLNPTGSNSQLGDLASLSPTLNTILSYLFFHIS